MRKLIFLFLVFFSVKNSFACSCGTTSSFCNSYTRFDLTASFEVVDTFSHGASLRIIQLLYGTENRDTITLWAYGGPFDEMCNPEPEHQSLDLRIGDTLILAFNRIDSAIASWQIVGDYALSGFDCLTSGLWVNNGVVQGLVSGHDYCHYANNCVYSRPYDDFITNLSSCGTWVGINDIEANKITVFPNPANNIISVECEPPTNFSVFDVAGRKQRVLFKKQDNTFTTNINELNSGIYFLQIQFDNGNAVTKKFVKE